MPHIMSMKWRPYANLSRTPDPKIRLNHSKGACDVIVSFKEYERRYIDSDEPQEEEDDDTDTEEEKEKSKVLVLSSGILILMGCLMFYTAMMFEESSGNSAYQRMMFFMAFLVLKFSIGLGYYALNGDEDSEETDDEEDDSPEGYEVTKSDLESNPGPSTSKFEINNEIRDAICNNLVFQLTNRKNEPSHGKSSKVAED